MSNPYLFGFENKQAAIEASEKYWNPDKTKFWQSEHIPLMIGKRERYDLYDVDGMKLIDVHINGGTYNLGHRNPELIQALQDALQYVDVGNHHFPSAIRTQLTKRLLETVPDVFNRVALVTTGSEAIDLAIKSARYATGRKKIVSIVKAFHGHTGFAVATGDERFAKLFHADRPDEFLHVPLNDIEAMEKVLTDNEVAAVIMETIPATYGFPIPKKGYLAKVKALCEQTGALYIADEVQTGLMRTGEMWGIFKQGVVPDLLVTSKGLGGGIFPMGAIIMQNGPGSWLDKDGFAHMSTYGGSELGSAVALKVLEIISREETIQNIHRNIEVIGARLKALQSKFSDWFVGIRQDGLVIGLEFAHPEGAKPVMASLYKHGIWAIFSTLDPSVLQFKPGLLLNEPEVEDILVRLEAALKDTSDAFHQGTLF